MRKLGELTGIDTATISKIINGKRKANLDHLERISNYLHIPIGDLFEVSSFELDKRKSLHLISDGTFDLLFTSFDISGEMNTVSKVEEQLIEYKKHAYTDDGKNSILVKFDEKLKSIDASGLLVNQIKYMFDRFKNQQGSQLELATMGSALLYFIIPVDVIPDYLFAVGYLDDALAVQLISKNLMKET